MESVVETTNKGQSERAPHGAALYRPKPVEVNERPPDQPVDQTDARYGDETAGEEAFHLHY